MLGAGGGYYAMYGCPAAAAAMPPRTDADEPQLVVREGVSERRGRAARAPRARTGRPDPRVFQTTYIPLEGNFTSNLRAATTSSRSALGLSTFYDDHVKENVERNMMADPLGHHPDYLRGRSR